MEHSDSNNYQIACQRYFEFSHKTEDLVPINHPNQYFEQSMRILNGPFNKSSQINKSMMNNSYSGIKKEHIKIEMTQ
jgi:hypothetical protein